MYSVVRLGIFLFLHFFFYSDTHLYFQVIIKCFLNCRRFKIERENLEVKGWIPPDIKAQNENDLSCNNIFIRELFAVKIM